MVTYFYSHVAKVIAPHLPIDSETVEGMLIPIPIPDRALGDIAFPCFSMARAFHRAPARIASDLAEKVELSSPVASVTARGAYLNFQLDRGVAGAHVVGLALDPEWGSSHEGKGQTVCVDFCSPNVGRRMHLGHLRSAVIGKSLVRLHEAMGYQVIRINFVGDWGTQFGKLMAAWKRWGNPAAAEQDPIEELQRLYVRFHRAADENPAMEAEAHAWFRRLEEGDSEATELWEWIRRRSLQSMGATLSQLDITFDDYNGEAFYADWNRFVVDLLAERGLLTDSGDARVVELEGMSPCLIHKDDGSSLYENRDIAAAIHRQERYSPVRSLYVVDLGQSLHFQKVFAVLKKLGFQWAPRLRHVGFGVMRVADRRLRAPQGDVVFLGDVLRQAIDAAHAGLEGRNAGMEDADQIACSVGIGAVIFNDLRHNRRHHIDFDPEEAIRFDGETGPYVQYAHAQCCSLLRKAALKAESMTPVVHPVLGGDAEWALINAMADFPAAIKKAAERCEPHLVARSVLDVAKMLTRLYHDSPVLKAEEGVREARLTLVAAAAATLKRGLWILGLEAPLMRVD